MKCKPHPCHVTYSVHLLSPPLPPPPIVKNLSSALMPRHHTIRTTSATSPHVKCKKSDNFLKIPTRATPSSAREIRTEVFVGDTSADNVDSIETENHCGTTSADDVEAIDTDNHGDDVDGIETEVEEIGKNMRRIRSKVAINARLVTVWSILTDYERLSEFIPGLAVSELLEKGDSYARLFQIGQQKLAFGINFNARGIVDCFEKDLETLPSGQRRDIEFKMIEGDFQLFQGKWSIEQYNVERCEDGNPFKAEELHTILSYVVDVEPKLWLPVGLVEGRLRKEIKTNLSCIREEAHKRS